jgi:hypothetical protein
MNPPRVFAALIGLLLAMNPARAALAPLDTIHNLEAQALALVAAHARPSSVQSVVRELEDPLAAAGLTREMVTLPELPSRAKATPLSFAEVLQGLQGLGWLLVAWGLGLGLLRWRQSQMRKRAWLPDVKVAACPAPTAARSR